MKVKQFCHARQYLHDHPRTSGALGRVGHSQSYAVPYIYYRPNLAKFFMQGRYGIAPSRRSERVKFALGPERTAYSAISIGPLHHPPIARYE